jgi:rhamnosyltransferase
MSMGALYPPISIVIRSYNEAQYLPMCLAAIDKQVYSGDVEIILVDSGSTDFTIDIARSFGCNVIQIPQEKFSFGCSLNIGISHTKNEIVLVLSAHCVPRRSDWLQKMADPIKNLGVEMVYGRHVADMAARSSEINYFSSKFGGESGIKDIPMMNNGNAAFLKALWQERPFDELLTAQEDIDFSSWHINNGKRLFYSAEASVVHYHNDRNKMLFKRLNREVKVELVLGFITPLRVLLLLTRMPVKCFEDLFLAAGRGVFLRAFLGVFFFD